MTFPILLFALIVATCFIAYFADNLGKHLGKKRISLKIGRFSLRPRQTATLISMASSVAIMLLTLGFLLLFSKSIRNALLRYDAEKREANILRKKNQDLLHDLGIQRNKLEDQASDLSAQISKNKKLTTDVLQQRKQAVFQLRKANTSLAAVRASVTAAKAGQRTAMERARRAQERYAQEQARFKSVQSQLKNAQSQFNDARRRLNEEKKRVVEARQSLNSTREQARRNLQEALSRQQEASTRLKEASERLIKTESNYEAVKSQVAKTLEQYNLAIANVQELDKRSIELQAKLAEQTLTLQNAADIAYDIATGNVSIHLGDVFAEKTFLPGMSSRQAREALQELLKAGREKLQSLQAPVRTLELIQPQTVAPGEDGSPLTEEEFLRGFAADLSTLNAAASVRLVAARDHSSRETNIRAFLTLVVVRVIFPAGDVLASADIDAGDSDGQIFKQLLDLLNETEKRARERRVAPLITPENPYFYAPGTNERIFEALRRIQVAGGRVKVEVVAAEDVKTVESVKVRFEITREQPDA